MKRRYVGLDYRHAEFLQLFEHVVFLLEGKFVVVR